MTSPKLSYDALKFGRVYFKPGSEDIISMLDGVRDNESVFYSHIEKFLSDDVCYPSITNVLSAVPDDFREASVGMGLNYMKGKMDKMVWIVFNEVRESFNNGNSYDLDARLKELKVMMFDKWDEFSDGAVYASEDNLNKASDRGTNLHFLAEMLGDEDYQSIIEAYKNGDRGKLAMVDGYRTNLKQSDIVMHDYWWGRPKKFDNMKYVEPLLKFMDDYKPKFIAQEATVFGETDDGLKYAGTTDGIIELDGKVYVLDYKFTSEIHGQVSLQLAAAAKAKYVTFDDENVVDMIPVDGALALNVSKDKTFVDGRKSRTYGKYYYELFESDIDPSWVEFQNARRVWSYAKDKDKFIRSRGRVFGSVKDGGLF